MSTVTSPLRYPGSKQKAMKLIKLYWNKVIRTTHEYREPFIGGGSIYFNLITEGKKVWLNDKDPNIAALFEVMRDNPNDLCELINTTKPTINIWEKIRYSDTNTKLEMAFKTLFLNRTNYSGILSAAPIGGYRQESEYPIDCRWNPKTLQSRILQCSIALQNTEITSEDFFYLIIAPSKGNVFLMIDPPYYKKGNQLYDVGMTHEDHVRLRDLLVTTNHKFLLTYDNCEEIIELYQNIGGIHLFNFGWSYSAATVRNVKRKIGNEIFITNIENIAETLEEMESYA